MKNCIATVCLFFIGMTAFGQEEVKIESGSSLELSYEKFSTCLVEIKNKSTNSFEVAVEDSATDKWIKGFGLGPKAKVSVDVAPEQVLIFTNDSDTDIEVTLKFIERTAPIKAIDASKMVTFTLHNSSAKSIPLVIPSVMNPNLSPFSDSGVKLQMGQKIYYKKKGKKKLLLIVDDSIAEGAKIDVAKRIRKLEKEN
jgi:hypothetical protein